MEAGEFTDEDFFRTVSASGARVLLIGRRALILLGAPVMTSDYDVWLHIDDIEKLNTAFRPFDHLPNRSADEARQFGRYVLENGEHIDVMVARAQSDARGTRLDFDGAWSRKQTLEPLPGVAIHLPSIDDLIATKRWAARPRDIPPDRDPYDQRLSLEEFERQLARALESLDGPEGDDMLALVRWFRRRYPTPLSRARYATRKLAEARRFQGIGTR